MSTASSRGFSSAWVRRLSRCLPQEIEEEHPKRLSSRDVLSRTYSSAAGFKQNVVGKLAQNDLLPGSSRRGPKGCSV